MCHDLFLGTDVDKRFKWPWEWKKENKPTEVELYEMLVREIELNKELSKQDKVI